MNSSIFYIGLPMPDVWDRNLRKDFDALGSLKAPTSGAGMTPDNKYLNNGRPSVFAEVVHSKFI